MKTKKQNHHKTNVINNILIELHRKTNSQYKKLEISIKLNFKNNKLNLKS